LLVNPTPATALPATVAFEKNEVAESANHLHQTNKKF